MGLREDMDALGRAFDAGSHHAKYFRFGEAAREMMSPEEFDDAERAASKRLGKYLPWPSDPTASNPRMRTTRLEQARGD